MEEYVESFGFGRKLDSDFLGEETAMFPTGSFTTGVIGNRGTLTVLSLSIGQGAGVYAAANG